MVSEPLSEADGPACETCGKTTCPDADLPAFSEPVACPFAPIYRALRDARDCDYGCARDYTNQAVRLEVVGTVEQIIAGHTQALGDEVARLRVGIEALADDLRRLAVVLAEVDNVIAGMPVAEAEKRLRALLRDGEE